MKSLETRFGQLLRELREKRGLSQADLGADADLDRTYISLLETTANAYNNLCSCKGLAVSPSSMIKQLED